MAWLVSSGEYSDYRVEALFATKELAQRYVDIHKDGYRGSPQVDGEYQVIETMPDPVDHLRMWGHIGKDTSGDVHEEASIRVPGIDDTRFDVTVSVSLPRGSMLASIFLTVEGVDPERVRKAFSERQASALANFDLLVAQEESKVASRSGR